MSTETKQVTARRNVKRLREVFEPEVPSEGALVRPLPLVERALKRARREYEPSHQVLPISAVQTLENFDEQVRQRALFETRAADVERARAEEEKRRTEAEAKLGELQARLAQVEQAHAQSVEELKVAQSDLKLQRDTARALQEQEQKLITALSQGAAPGQQQQLMSLVQTMQSNLASVATQAQTAGHDVAELKREAAAWAAERGALLQEIRELAEELELPAYDPHTLPMLFETVPHDSACLMYGVLQRQVWDRLYDTVASDGVRAMRNLALGQMVDPALGRGTAPGYVRQAYAQLEGDLDAMKDVVAEGYERGLSAAATPGGPRQWTFAPRLPQTPALCARVRVPAPKALLGLQAFAPAAAIERRLPAPRPLPTAGAPAIEFKQPRLPSPTAGGPVIVAKPTAGPMEVEVEAPATPTTRPPALTFSPSAASSAASSPAAAAGLLVASPTSAPSSPQAIAGLLQQVQTPTAASGGGQAAMETGYYYYW